VRRVRRRGVPPAVRRCGCACGCVVGSGPGGASSPSSPGIRPYPGSAGRTAVSREWWVSAGQSRATDCEAPPRPAPVVRRLRPGAPAGERFFRGAGNCATSHDAPALARAPVPAELSGALTGSKGRSPWGTGRAGAAGAREKGGAPWAQRKKNRSTRGWTGSAPNRRGRALGTSARDLAGLDARGASVHALRRPTDHGTHALDVRVPATGRTAVRVGNVVAEARPLAADVAVGSHRSLQRLQMHVHWEIPARRESVRIRVALPGKGPTWIGQPEQHTTAASVQRNYHVRHRPPTGT